MPIIGEITRRELFKRTADVCIARPLSKFADKVEGVIDLVDRIDRTYGGTDLLQTTEVIDLDAENVDTFKIFSSAASGDAVDVKVMGDTLTLQELAMYQILGEGLLTTDVLHDESVARNRFNTHVNSNNTVKNANIYFMAGRVCHERRTKESSLRDRYKDSTCR
jgi:hypothetical protein